MKNIVNLDTCFFPWESEQANSTFVAYYNNERYHELLDNLTPADVFFRKAKEVKNKREETKRKTLEQRRCLNRQMAQNDLSLGR